MVWETGVQSQVESYQRLKKMVLDAALLSTQHYKVRIKGKMEQSWGWNSALPLHFGVVAIEKGAFGSPSTKVANFTFLSKKKKKISMQVKVHFLEREKWNWLYPGKVINYMQVLLDDIQ